MKVPLWKKCLSYLWELPVESVEGKAGLTLHVCLSRGRFQLFTGKAIYSFGDLYYNFYKAFKVIKIRKRKIENVLLLGLGLGSIPIILERKFNIRGHYTGVEWDEQVLYLAEKYVLHKLRSPMTMIVSDAALFVQDHRESYDLICMDVFVEDKTPEIFHNPPFLKDLHALLKPDAVVLFNCLYRNEKDISQTNAFFINHFQQYFSDTKKCIIKGSCILIGYHQ